MSDLMDVPEREGTWRLSRSSGHQAGGGHAGGIGRRGPWGSAWYLRFAAVCALRHIVRPPSAQPTRRGAGRFAHRTHERSARFRDRRARMDPAGRRSGERAPAGPGVLPDRRLRLPVSQLGDGMRTRTLTLGIPPAEDLPCLGIMTFGTAPMRSLRHCRLRGSTSSAIRGWRSRSARRLPGSSAWKTRGSAALATTGAGRICAAGCAPARQAVNRVLAAIPPGVPSLLLVHNPDFMQWMTERPVDLALAGHTHGGQVVLPGIGPLVLPSCFGRTYARGLVQSPAARCTSTAGPG